MFENFSDRSGECLRREQFNAYSYGNTVHTFSNLESAAGDYHVTLYNAIDAKVIDTEKYLEKGINETTSDVIAALSSD